MAITLQPFVWFTSFNFWLVGLDSLYYCSLVVVVGVTQTPSSRHNTAVGTNTGENLAHKQTHRDFSNFNKIIRILYSTLDS